MKLKKYLIKYTFEFVVIVIGISASFWIDEWNINKTNRIQHIEDLKAVLNDLKNDSIMFDNVQKKLDAGKLKINELLIDIESFESKKISYLEYSSRIINKGFVYTNDTFFMTDASFKSLISNSRINFFPEEIHTIMNKYYESILKRVNDNNHMVDDITLKYYHDFHPFSMYYVNTLIDLGYSESEARASLPSQIDNKTKDRFNLYFKKSDIKEIYTSTYFLIRTSNLKNRIYKYNTQISEFKNHRDLISKRIHEHLRELVNTN
tara:strand:+ start:7383 stop:8171 length:789 start_codon:yes stop_codon:yes gene_type:complete